MQILRLLIKPTTYLKSIPRIASPVLLKRSMSVSTITQELSKLGLNQPEPAKDTYPDYNVVDVFRNYIGDELNRISGIDKEIIVQALDTPKLLDQGDLIVPIPKLRLKGVNPNEKSKHISSH